MKALLIFSILVSSSVFANLDCSLFVGGENYGLGIRDEASKDFYKSYNSKKVAIAKTVENFTFSAYGISQYGTLTLEVKITENNSGILSSSVTNSNDKAFAHQTFKIDNTEASISCYLSK